MLRFRDAEVKGCLSIEVAITSTIVGGKSNRRCAPRGHRLHVAPSIFIPALLGIAAVCSAGAACRPSPEAELVAGLLRVSVRSSEAVDHEELDKRVASLAEQREASGISDESDNPLASLFYALSPPNTAASVVSMVKVRDAPSDSRAAILVFDGIPDDDSVSGYRYDVALRRDQGRWRITEARMAWRCWPGRGHRHFSIDPCT